MEAKAYIKDGKVIVNYLELHASFACNLSCESCSHFSNQNHKGNVSLEMMREWVEPWKDKIRPLRLNILGGEPFLNLELGEILKYLRDTFNPLEEMYITTNGLLLSKNEYIKDYLIQNDVYLSISMHSFGSKYQEKIHPIHDLLNAWNIYGIKSVWKDAVSNWTRRYHGLGDQMKPFEDNDPKASWSICKGKYCVQLFRSKLWKCAPLAYLNLQNEKYNLDDIWKQYLQYEGLSSESSLQEIVDFYEKKEEGYCSMCPAKDVFFIKDPFHS
jgi:hypothetical protein